MSYSFSFTVHTKAEARERVTQEFERIVNVQPVHAADQSAAVATAWAYIDMLKDAPDMDIAVNMHGSLSWAGTADAANVTGSSVGFSAYLVAASKEG